jgi:hypothetical protein
VLVGDRAQAAINITSAFDTQLMIWTIKIDFLGAKSGIITQYEPGKLWRHCKEGTY